MYVYLNVNPGRNLFWHGQEISGKEMVSLNFDEWELLTNFLFSLVDRGGRGFGGSRGYGGHGGRSGDFRDFRRWTAAWWLQHFSGMFFNLFRALSKIQFFPLKKIYLPLWRLFFGRSRNWKRFGLFRVWLGQGWLKQRLNTLACCSEEELSSGSGSVVLLIWY